MAFRLQRICIFFIAQRIKLAIVGIILVSLTGCEKPVELLQIGHNLRPAYNIAALARDLGYLNNLPVRLVEYSSTTQVLGAFQSGLIQGAFLTLDEVLLLRSRGFRAQIVLVVGESRGADAILGRPPMATLNNIQGRRLGVEDSAVSSFLLFKALQRANMQLSDVQVVAIEVDQHERAYREDRIDAVVTFEPVRSQLLAQGAKVLFDSSQLPGEIIDVLAVEEGAWENHRDTLAKLISAWFKASSHLRNQPNDAIQRIGTHLRLSPQTIQANYRGVHWLTLEENFALFRGKPNKIDMAAAQTWALMSEHRVLSHAVNEKAGLDGLVNSSLLPKAINAR